MMFCCERLLFLCRACYLGNLVAVCLTKLAAKQYPHTFPMFGWWFFHSNPHFTEAVPLPCLLATPLYPRQILPVPSMFNLCSSVYPNKSWQLLCLDDFPRVLAIFSWQLPIQSRGLSSGDHAQKPGPREFAAPARSLPRRPAFLGDYCLGWWMATEKRENYMLVGGFKHGGGSKPIYLGE